MATNTLPATYTTDDPMLRLAVAAHLARYKGESRAHTASDLGSYLRWCFEQGVMPLQAQRGHVELYLRWLQEVRRLKPSTVSPAPVSARDLLPDLLGLRIFEATGSDVTALGEARGHRVLKVLGKGDKTALIPLPPVVGRAVDRAVCGRATGAILLNRAGRRMDRHAATADSATWRGPPASRRLACTHMLRHTFVTTMLDAGVDLRDVQIAARHADPRTTMRYDRARNNLDRHPNYILAAFMASAT